MNFNSIIESRGAKVGIFGAGSSIVDKNGNDIVMSHLQLLYHMLDKVGTVYDKPNHIFPDLLVAIVKTSEHIDNAHEKNKRLEDFKCKIEITENFCVDIKEVFFEHDTIKISLSFQYKLTNLPLELECNHFQNNSVVNGETEFMCYYRCIDSDR